MAARVEIQNLLVINRPGSTAQATLVVELAIKAAKAIAVNLLTFIVFPPFGMPK